MNMTLVSLLILIVIAGVCGAIGYAIAGYSRSGLIASIAVGFIGAIIGVWVAGQFGLPEYFAVNVDGERFPIIWSIVGSALFVAALGLFLRIDSRRRGWSA
jgi:uncharacterized membrane protein YeaQ/YmgE (transglycosylase-associated protein family)